MSADNTDLDKLSNAELADYIEQAATSHAARYPKEDYAEANSRLGAGTLEFMNRFPRECWHKGNARTIQMLRREP